MVYLLDKQRLLRYNRCMNNDNQTILDLNSSGKSVKEIIAETGLSRSKVYKVIHDANNNNTRIPKKRGRKAGEKLLLTEEQSRSMFKLLVTSSPKQHGFSKDVIWSKRSIEKLIGSDAIDMELSRNTVVNYLVRYGLYHPRPSIPSQLQQYFPKGVQVLRLTILSLSSDPGIVEQLKACGLDISKCYHLICARDSLNRYYFRVKSSKTNRDVLGWLNTFISDLPECTPRISFERVFCKIPESLAPDNIRLQWKRGNYYCIDKIQFYLY